MGLLDEGFLTSPAGIGLLSAVAGGLAGARRGAPINNMGRAGLAGLMGYSNALTAQERAEICIENHTKLLASLQAASAASADLAEKLSGAHKQARKRELESDVAESSSDSDPDALSRQGSAQQYAAAGLAQALEDSILVDREEQPAQQQAFDVPSETEYSFNDVPPPPVKTEASDSDEHVHQPAASRRRIDEPQRGLRQ